MMTLKQFFKMPRSREFIRWLKNEGCYTFYSEEIVKYFNQTASRVDEYRKMGILEWIEYKPTREWINYAFTWADTKQGHKFWSEKDILWKLFCKNHRY